MRNGAEKIVSEDQSAPCVPLLQSNFLQDSPTSFSEQADVCSPVAQGSCSTMHLLIMTILNIIVL